MHHMYIPLNAVPIILDPNTSTRTAGNDLEKTLYRSCLTSMHVWYRMVWFGLIAAFKTSIIWYGWQLAKPIETSLCMALNMVDVASAPAAGFAFFFGRFLFLLSFICWFCSSVAGFVVSVFGAGASFGLSLLLPLVIAASLLRTSCVVAMLFFVNDIGYIWLQFPFFCNVSNSLKIQTMQNVCVW